MKKYENGKIYKIEPICEHEEGDIYIGSTAQKYLCNRMVKHKQDYKKFKNETKYIQIVTFVRSSKINWLLGIVKKLRADRS